MFTVNKYSVINEHFVKTLTIGIFKDEISTIEFIWVLAYCKRVCWIRIYYDNNLDNIKLKF